MPFRRIAVFPLPLATALSGPIGAQVRADPGTVINGCVAVRVYVTLSDEETSHATIGDVNLRFFRTTAGTIVLVRTDAAGSATTMLAPGEYRLMSPAAATMYAFFLPGSGQMYSGERAKGAGLDAGDAARRFNAAHGIARAGLEPIVVPGAAGQTRLGVSVALRR